MFETKNQSHDSTLVEWKFVTFRYTREKIEWKSEEKVTLVPTFFFSNSTPHYLILFKIYNSRPGQSSQIKSSYKSEIARTLEPWISHGSVGGSGPTGTSVPPSTLLPKDYTHPSINLTSVDPTTFTEPTYSQYYPMSRSTVTPHGPPAPPPPPKTPQRTDAGYAAPLPPPGGRKTPTSKATKSTFDAVEDQFAAHSRSFSTFLNVRKWRMIEMARGLVPTRVPHNL